MYCPIYKGQCPDDCVFHLGIGEECLIINALQAFIKDKQAINKEREKVKNDKYMEYLNEMYSICLSAVDNADSKIKIQNSYEDAIQESDEDFIIPI